MICSVRTFSEPLYLHLDVSTASETLDLLPSDSLFLIKHPNFEFSRSIFPPVLLQAIQQITSLARLHICSIYPRKLCINDSQYKMTSTLAQIRYFMQFGVGAEEDLSLMYLDHNLLPFLLAAERSSYNRRNLLWIACSP